MESRVGRSSPSFYVLMADDQRLAYLWRRALFTNLPHVPQRLRLEMYELWNENLWVSMFWDCQDGAERMKRLQEYVHDGDITLQRLQRSPSSNEVRMLIYDGEQIDIETPPKYAEEFDVNGVRFPKSLAWSNLIVKERK